MSSYFNEDRVNREVGFLSLLRLMWPFMRPYRKALFWVFILVLLYSGVSRVLPIVFGKAIDIGMAQKSMQVVYLLAGVYLLIEIFKMLLQFAQNYFMQRVNNRVLYRLRERLIRHLQMLPMSFFDRNPIGRVVTRATNDVAALGDLFTQGFTAFFVNTIELISIFVALMLISPRLTFWVMLIAPPMLYIVLFVSRRLRHHFKESKRKLAIINAYTSESISGMKILQIFDRQEQSRQRFLEMSEDFRREQMKTVSLFATLWPVLEFFNIGTVTSTLFFGALYHQKFGMTIGDLAAFVLLVQSFFRPLRVILEKYNTLQNALASADRVFNIFEEPVDQASGGSIEPRVLRGAIQIRDLWFRYGDQLPWVLKGISFEVRPGERVAIVGRTGSGKSSLISLLQRLYPFQKGEILIDGNPLGQIQARAVRRLIGVVQQDNYLFRGSIASNISLDDPEITREQILSAAQRAHCAPIIARQVLGIDSRVEERGANLSLGERQLIAFARVLAHDPDILVLDEATSNVDSVSERLIQEATEAITKDRTSIIIAHRLSTIVNSDRILVLQDGELIESGTFADLMQLKGNFYQMYLAQLFGSQSAASQSSGVSGPEIKTPS